MSPHPPSIRVSTGNFASAMFLSVGRDVRDLMRNPIAFIGGVAGLALSSLALWFGGGAIANAAESQCKEFIADLTTRETAFDEAATKLADLDTKIGSITERIEGLDAELATALPELKPQLELEKGEAQKELAPLQAERPAVEKAMEEKRLAVDEQRAKVEGEGCELEDEFEIDFTPGTIAKLGEKPEDLPEKVIIADTRAPDPIEEEPTQETVTEDEKAKPTEEPKDKPKDVTKDKPTVKDNKDKKLPTSKNPTDKNTPYNDLPTYDKNLGNPFGDPEGWDDLTRDGDPWATSVMKALNNMPIGAYAAKAKQGEMKFQLTICKDGKIKQVLKKGGNLPEDGQSAVMLALEQLEIPKPPKKVSDAMPGNCAKIKYTFVWSAKGVK
jgi:hypothetical protein